MHRHTARYHQRYQAIATPKNRYVLAARGYASAHHDCVLGRGHVNGHGHHHANGHVNRRVHDRGRLRVGDHGHVNDRGHVNGCAGVGADVHVHGCVPHCSTASCFW